MVLDTESPASPPHLRRGSRRLTESKIGARETTQRNRVDRAKVASDGGNSPRSTRNAIAASRALKQKRMMRGQRGSGGGGGGTSQHEKHGDEESVFSSSTRGSYTSSRKSELTDKAKQRRAARRSARQKLDRVRGGAAAKVMLTGVPSDAVVISPDRVPTGGRTVSPQVPSTPSTASLSSPSPEVSPEERAKASIVDSLTKRLFEGPDDEIDRTDKYASHGNFASVSFEGDELGDGISPLQIQDAINFAKVEYEYGESGEAEVEILSAGEKSYDEDREVDEGEVGKRRDARYKVIQTENDSVRESAKREWAGGGIALNSHWSEGHFNDTGAAYSEASLPTALCQSEIFHENAAAAIASLLTPKRMRAAGLLAPDDDPAERRLSDGPSSSDIGETPYGLPRDTDTSSIVSGGGWNGTAEVSKVLSTPLLDEATKAMLEGIRSRMKMPSKQLSDLLSQIHRPANQEVGRGYMTRRKNACGALKVLSVEDKNRVQVCWTVGVLTSITSVLADSGPMGAELEYSDASTRSAYIEARNRAVATLLNLAVKKQNRILIFHSPDLLHNMGKVISFDKGESCQGLCSVLAYLSKTAENRLLMCRVPGIIEAMTRVICHPKKKGKDDTDKSGDKGWGKNRFMKAFESDDDGSDSSVSASAVSDGSHLASSVVPDEVSINTDNTPRLQNNLSSRKSLVALDGLDDYDKDPNQFLHGARLSVFAVLLHLVKEKDNAYILARNEPLMNTLVDVSQRHASLSHARAVVLLANLTRHPDNADYMTFRVKNLLQCLGEATRSPNEEARKHALFALQNLSMTKSCRSIIANMHNVLAALSHKALSNGYEEEQMAAVSTLRNLTGEPGNLIPMTNSPECIATLMQVARGQDVVTTEMLRYVACDALATLSQWLRKIATSGILVEEGTGCILPSGDELPRSKKRLYDPMHQTSNYEQWK